MVVFTKPLLLPVNADRPLIGLAPLLDKDPLYPPEIIRLPRSVQVEPPSVLISTTPPSQVGSALIYPWKVSLGGFAGNVMVLVVCMI